MWRTNLFVGVMILVVSLFSFPASAMQQFKCKGENIYIGDTTYHVKKLCGEPSDTENFCGDKVGGYQLWFYDCTGYQKVYILKFSPFLTEISTGGDASQPGECGR